MSRGARTPIPNKRHAGADAGKAGDQSRLGSRAARRMHHMIDAQPQVIGLPDEFHGGIDIAERADGIRSSARNEVRLASFAFESCGDFGEFAIHIRIGGAALDAGAMQMVQQHIAAFVVVVVGLAGPIFEQNVAVDAHFCGACRGLARMI